MKMRYCILCLLSFVMVGCVSDFSPFDSNDFNEYKATQTQLTDTDEQVFYYFGYENRKIFLDQVTRVRKDQILNCYESHARFLDSTVLH